MPPSAPTGSSTRSTKMSRLFNFAPARNASSNLPKSEEPKKWSEEDYKAAFRLFDKDHDGTITRKEVQMVLGTLGQQATQEEVDGLIGEVSADY